jgi:predicted dehydrogenase
MVSIGLIGCGAWGRNYLKTLSSIADVKIRAVCDSNEEALQEVKKARPETKITTDFMELVADDSLAGVIVATPPQSHFSIAAEFLAQGKAVLVEKPCALSYRETLDLVFIAQQNKTVFMVGHLMEYHPAVLKMHDCIRQGMLGSLHYILLERAGFLKAKTTVGVHWDLAVHDLSIVRCLVDENPRWISAYGLRCVRRNAYDMVDISMQFGSGLLVRICGNCISPVKKRQALLVGKKGAMLFDDDKDASKLQLVSFAEGVAVPNVENQLPLTNQCRHFAQCIEKNLCPRTGAKDMLWVVKATELVEQSLFHNGKKISWDENGGADYEN